MSSLSRQYICCGSTQPVSKSKSEAKLDDVIFEKVDAENAQRHLGSYHLQGSNSAGVKRKYEEGCELKPQHVYWRLYNSFFF